MRWNLSAAIVLRNARFLVCAAAVWISSAGYSIEPSTEEAIARGLNYFMQGTFQSYGYLGYGCGFADLDNDGDPDAIIIGAANARVGIFENNGAGYFTDRSLTSGIPLLPQGSGLAAADYDGDGDLDINFTQLGAGNKLVRNEGGFQFTDVTNLAGVTDTGAGKGCAWGDFNNDGWVDLFIANYDGVFPGTANEPDRLYKNLGDGTFQDVSAQQTVNNPGFGFQAAWTDYDRDGDVDLYLCNDRGHVPPLFIPNQLWRNDNGHLVNISLASGAGMGLFAMGLACGDFDANRWPDLYVTNVGNESGNYPVGNPLFLNDGDGTFTQSAAMAGVSVFLTGWGCIFFDHDNNGYLDLYVNNQAASDWMFLNYGSFPLSNFGPACGVGGPTGTAKPSFGSAVADVDNDGDLDILANHMGGNVHLYINHEGDNRNWIKYKVIGSDTNTAAIGGNVDTRVGKVWQWREIISGSNSYLSQNELIVHVGLGQTTIVDEVVVDWPGGWAGDFTRTLTNLPANQTWTIYPPPALGDGDGDGLSTLSDYFAFMNCYNAGFAPGCEMMDFDGDSVLDGSDFYDFLTNYDGPLDDCDDNGAFDFVQIFENQALDADFNGVLDSCENPGDITGDGAVDVDDLLAVINAWGPCPITCPADTNGNGIVDVDDLLTVINGWD